MRVLYLLALFLSSCAHLTIGDMPAPPPPERDVELTPSPPVAAVHGMAIEKTLTSIASPQRVIHVSASEGDDSHPCTTPGTLRVRTIERAVSCSRINEDIILDDADIHGSAIFKSGGREGKPIRIIAARQSHWKGTLTIRGGFVQLHGINIDKVVVHPPRLFAAGLAFFRSTIDHLTMENVGSPIKDPGIPANLISQSKIGKANIDGYSVHFYDSVIDSLKLSGARHYFKNVQVTRDTRWNAHDTLVAGESTFLGRFHLGPDGDNPVFANTEFHGFVRLGARGARTVIGPMFFRCLWRREPEQVNVKSFMQEGCLTFEEKAAQDKEKREKAVP